MVPVPILTGGYMLCELIAGLWLGSLALVSVERLAAIAERRMCPLLNASYRPTSPTRVPLSGLCSPTSDGGDCTDGSSANTLCVAIANAVAKFPSLH